MFSSSAFSAYPPHRHFTTTRVPPSRALSLLSAYLTASEQDVSLHPNALVSESGPKAAVTSSSSSTGHTRGEGGRGGLVLHNLRRVEAGLKGENLGAGAELAFRGGLLEGKDEDVESRSRTSLRSVGVGEGPTTARAGTGSGLEGEDDEDEWQDREEFEREQVVVGGGALGEKGMEVERRDREVNEVEVPRVKETKTTGDKEERKKRKKEKRLKARREKAMKQQPSRIVEG
ncbi:hypothetical protein MMC07_006288 [Pseudocyphellaria aurata]|nr:hypothetical protein [Pseudocyphellaria aurata]